MQDEEQDGLRPAAHDDLYSGRSLQTANEEEAREIAALYERERIRQREMDEDMAQVAYWMVPVQVCEVEHEQMFRKLSNDIQVGKETRTAERMNELLPEGMKTVAVPWFKGRVYVECPKTIIPDSIVRLCVTTVETAYVHRRIERVSEEDCEVLRQTLKENKNTMTPFEAGSWAKVRRGTFSGDIARVLRVEEDSDVVELVLVPRLWQGTRKRARRTGKSERAVQGLFSPEMTERWRGFERSRMQPGVEEGSWTIDNEEHYLSNGLRIMKVTGLHLLKRCRPKANEVELFTMAGIDTLRETNRELLRTRDDVTVVKGALRGTNGRVISMKEDVVRIEVGCKGDSNATVYEVDVDEVRRQFRQGDHVQVCIGIDSGRRGIVTDIGETDVTLVDFSNKRQVCFKELHRWTSLKFYFSGVCCKRS